MSFVNDLPPDLGVGDFCRDHLILIIANKGFSVDITNNISHCIHLFIQAKTFLILAMDQKLQKPRKNSGIISLMGVNELRILNGTFCLFICLFYKQQ